MGIKKYNLLIFVTFFISINIFLISSNNVYSQLGTSGDSSAYVTHTIGYTTIDGKECVIAWVHDYCSNARDTSHAGGGRGHTAIICRAEEKQPPNAVPPIQPTPPIQTTTTTSQPTIVAETTCMIDGDCQSEFICCESKCRDPSTGICKDVNGDEIPEWAPYTSQGNILNWLFGWK